MTNSVLYIFINLFLLWAHISFISQEKNHISKPSAPCTAASSWSGVRGSEPLPGADSVSLLAAPPALAYGELPGCAGAALSGAKDCPAQQTAAGRPRRGPSFLWALRRESLPGG